MIIGVLAGCVPFLAVVKLKGMLGYDDALDTFGVHAVGGTLGALLTGFWPCQPPSPMETLTPIRSTPIWHQPQGVRGPGLWIEQLKAMGLTIALAIVGTVSLPIS